MTFPKVNVTPVFISTSSFGQYDGGPLSSLERYGCRVISNPVGRKLKKEEAIRIFDEEPVVGLVAGTESLDREVLEHARSLRVISRCGAGIDNVDLETCRERKILVYSTPDAPTQAVAELTLGFILSLLRKLAAADRRLREGNWKPLMGTLLQGKSVGIIGFGRIGRALATLLRPFNCNILYFDPFVDDQIEGSTKTELQDLLVKADVISIHTQFVSGGKPLIGEYELRFMKRDAILVNTSRGGVVSEKALLEALQENRIAGAGLDVFENEPYQGPLTEQENVLLTSHMGSYAKECRNLMERQSVANLIEGLKSIGLIPK